MYQVSLTTIQTVEQDVRLLVEARSADEAVEIATKAVKQYPGKVTARGVNRLLVLTAEYRKPEVTIDKVSEVRNAEVD